MPLKAKLILLTLLPLLLVTASISWISLHQTKTLGDKEVEIFRDSLIKSRENALKDTVDLAFDAIEHIYNAPIFKKPKLKRKFEPYCLNLDMARMAISSLTIVTEPISFIRYSRN